MAELIEPSESDPPVFCHGPSTLRPPEVLVGPERLPGEVLCMIFQHLNVHQLKQIRHTCRCWKNIVDGSPQLKRKFVLKFPSGIIFGLDFHPAVPTVAGIRFESARIVSVDSWWPNWAETLVHLNLTRCTMSIRELASMLRQTVILESLTLNTVRCPRSNEEYADFQLDRVASLTVEHVSRPIFHLVCRVSPGIRELQYKNDWNPLAIYEYLPKWKRTLQKVHVRFVEALIVIERLTSAYLDCSVGQTGLSLFCQHQPNLEVLHITGMKLTKAILQEIGKTLVKLRNIAISLECEQVGPISFVNAMPNLESLTLSKLKEPVNLVLGQGPLKIGFNGCQNPKLKKLHLEGVQPTSYDDLRDYLKRAPELDSVNLHHCTVADLSILFETLPMAKLRNLSLKALCIITNSNGDSLVEYCENLQSLEVNAVLIPKETFVALFHLCPRLEAVTLIDLLTFCDDEMLILCQKLKRLATLTVQLCSISDKSAGHIIGYCRSLESLAIRDCDSVTQEACDQLAATGRFRFVTD